MNNNPLRYTDPTGYLPLPPPQPCFDGCPGDGGGSGGGGGNGGGGNGGGGDNGSGSGTNPDLCQMYGEGCGGGGKPMYSPIREDDCPNASAYSLSVCAYLSPSEMHELYEQLGDYGTFNSVIGILSALGGVGLSASSVALILMGVGVSAAVGTAIIAAAPVVGLAALIIGIDMIIAGEEVSSLQGNIFETGAGELGGTLTVDSYILVNKYTVTTEKGSDSTWGITNITPSLLAVDLFPKHPEWFQNH